MHNKKPKLFTKTYMWYTYKTVERDLCYNFYRNLTFAWELSRHFFRRIIVKKNYEDPYSKGVRTITSLIFSKREC